MTWVWYRGRFRRPGSDVDLHLANAQEFFDRGDQKRAVRELWFAGFLARGDADALRGVLALAAACEGRAKPRRKSKLAELVQVLHDDIDTAVGQAAASAASGDTVAARGVGSGWGLLAAVVGGAVLGALIGAVIGGLTYQPCTDCFLDLGRGVNVIAGAIWGSLIGPVAGLILWLVWWAQRP